MKDEVVAVEPKLHNFGIAAVLLFYSTVSVTLVYVNKRLFSVLMPAPVFLTAIQQVLGVIMLSLVCHGSRLTGYRSLYERRPSWNEMCKMIIPSLVMVGMIAFSNTCLKEVQVSTYQVARSMTVVMSALLSIWILGIVPSRWQWISIGVVTVGFAVGSTDVRSLSVYGMTLGLMASGFQCMYNVLIKKYLAYVDGDEVKVMYATLTFSGIGLFIVALAIQEPIAYPASLPTTIITTIMSAVLGLLMMLASYMCIKYTSPVTFNVTGYCKAVVQCLGGILFMGDILTFRSGIAIVLTLCGGLMYSQVKMYEQRKSERAVYLEPIETEGQEEV